MSKQYGLIVPGKNPSGSGTAPGPATRPSVFGSDSDSDTESARPTGLKTALKRQDKLIQAKAVEEDPTVFQYDEVYDEMDAKRKESKLSRKDLDKKPKYINKLIQSADRRKREYERRIERQVQREREAEGEEYKDKESFVTSAYRSKLEEMKQLDEEEKREDYLESIGDVTRQGNLDGFYRHLYDQKVLYEDKVDEKPPTNKKRKYRKHEGSDSEPEPEAAPTPALQHLPSNIDADSDFSIDSSGSDDETTEIKKIKTEQEDPKPNVETFQIPVIEPSQEETVKEEVTHVLEEVKPKLDIWKKRTVGAVFDEALKRYFARKAAREAGTYIRPSL